MYQIKELLSRIIDRCRLDVAIVKELEEQASRIKILEENRKAKDATISHLTQELAQIKLMLRKKV